MKEIKQKIFANLKGLNKFVKENKEIEIISIVDLIVGVKLYYR